MTLERAVAAIVGVALILIAVRASRRSLRLFGSPVDVLALYLTLWGVALSIFAIPLIAYSTTPIAAWIGIYGAIATGAVAGWIVVRRMDGPRSAPVEVAATFSQSIDSRRLRICWAISAVLGLVGMMSFVYAISRVLPWSAVVVDPQAVREVKRDSVLFQETYDLTKLLTYFNQVAFVIWTIGLRIGAFRGWWWPARYVGAASILPFLITADRGLLIATVTWAGVLHLAWPQRVAPRRVLALVITVVCLAGAGVTVVGNRYGGSIEAHPEVAASLTTRAVDPLAIPYLYLTANIPTYGQLTSDRLAPLSAGGQTFLPLTKAMERVGVPVRPAVGTGVFYAIPFESFSNYGWLGSFWLDFRLPGVLLLPALVVAAAAFFQRRVRRKPTIASLWITSLLLYVIVFSPFANALSATLTWQFLLLTPVIAAALDSRLAAVWTARLARRQTRRRIAAAACGLVVGGVALGAYAGLPSDVPDEPARVQVEPVLLETAQKAQVMYRQGGRYPGSVGLAGRLQVNRPDLAFEAQGSYSEPVPLAPGVIAVFSRPKDVFLRTRDAEGRVFEIHRTEEWGGITFGPGTRDR